MHTARAQLQRALRLAGRLIVLADEGEAEAKDDGCILLFGVVRDCAYRMRSETEKRLAPCKARSHGALPGCGLRRANRAGGEPRGKGGTR